MKKKTTQKISYRISEADNILHRFSPFGYESLSDTFIDYLERRRVEIPKDAELTIDVDSGNCALSEEQKTAIDRAYRGHYLLLLSEAENRLKKAMIKTFWFILSTLASSLLLLIVEPQTEEWVVQFAYLPIWFFGYRILIYCIFDLPSIRKEISWRKQQLHAKLSFAGSEFCCNTEKEREAHHSSFVKEYFMEGNTVLLECVPPHAQDLLFEGCTDGEDLISEELVSYLEQAAPFIEKNHTVKLTLGGEKLSEHELMRIRNGIRNHFSLRLNEVDEQLEVNNRQIKLFSAGLVIISFVLYTVGCHLDVRYHEIVLIILWFFADYLCEFLLLTPWELHKEKDRWDKMKKIEIDQKNDSSICHL